MNGTSVVAAPRRRPLWLVGALAALSIGVYIPIWFGLTWAELRRERRDATMSPLGHALSLFVPVFGVWQAYRHFRVLDSMLRAVDKTRGVDAVTAAIGTGIWWLTFTHYSLDPIFMLLDAVELAAGTAVVVYGQRALNAYWRARPGPEVQERVTELDWMALAIAASYALLTIVGFLGAPS